MLHAISDCSFDLHGDVARHVKSKTDTAGLLAVGDVINALGKQVAVRNRNPTCGFIVLDRLGKLASFAQCRDYARLPAMAGYIDRQLDG